MGNRNIGFIQVNKNRMILNPPNPLFQRGNIPIIFLLLAFFTTCTSISYAIEPIPNFLTTFYGSMKLKEELNLNGASLKELIGDSQKLSGLTQVNLKNYETSEAMDNSTMESFSNGYRERLTDEGWQMLMMGMNSGRIITIYELIKENVREKLMAVIVGPTEVSEMILIGKVELSALEDLRDVLLKAMPKFSELKPMAEVLKIEASPSQYPIDAIARWTELIDKYGDAAPFQVYYELAFAYEKMGDYIKALELYKSLIDNRNSRNIMLLETYYWAGWCSERILEFDSARKYYILLLENFGGLQTNDDDYIASAEMALLRLDKVKDEPLSNMILAEKAQNLYLRQRNYPEAIDIYTVLASDMPEENAKFTLDSKLGSSKSAYAPTAMLMIALAFGHTKQYELQTKVLEISVEKYPNSIGRLYMGMAYQNQDKYKEALEQYKTIFSDYPNASPWQSLTAYYNAAECAKKLDKLDQAKEYYKKVVDMYSSINSPMVGDVEREILKIERGGKLPFLGLGFRYRESREGAYIVTIFKNGPCKDAGVQRSDLLLAIDSEKTPDPNVVVKIIAKKNIGDKIVLSIRRGEDTLEIPVTLTATPEKLER
jgi:tetratricopeptide (TPR) repeat protein